MSALTLWGETRALGSVMAQQYRVTLAIEMQYRVTTALWLLGAIIEPIVGLLVWTAVARTQGGSVDGMSIADFGAYFAVAFVVGEVTYTYSSYLMAREVRSGDFSATLVRPVTPVLLMVARFLADKTIRVVMVLIVFVAIVLLFQVQFSTNWWSVALFVPVVALATAIYFACDYMIALSSFWVTNTEALGRCFDVIFVILSGFFAPLQLYPPAFQVITWLLPFRWVIAFPIDLVLGKLTLQESAIGILMQLGWLAALIAATTVVWKHAVKQHAAVGG